MAWAEDGTKERAMAIAVTVTKVTKLQNQFKVEFTLVASGSYVTNGDTVNFLTATYPIGSAFHGTAAPTANSVGSVASPASGYEYVLAPGSSAANCLLQVFEQNATTGGLVQISASSYPAGVSGDTIQGFAFFPSFS